MVENNVLFPTVSYFINKVTPYLRVIWIYLTTPLIYRHEYRFDTTCSLGHQRSRACRSNSEKSDIPASMNTHTFIQIRISISQTLNKWIVLFTFSVIDCECTSFCSQIH